MKTTTLYRPVGIKELELIAASGWKAFPPRLEWQPIFYPVIHQQYAERIAGEWNVNDAFSGYCGIVTSFEVNSFFLNAYPIQNVGGSLHDELWIPAEDLSAFNSNIAGNIHPVKAFFGSQFTMPEKAVIHSTLLKLK